MTVIREGFRDYSQSAEAYDGQVKGAVICVQSKGKKGTTTLRRPVTHLYPLETSCEIEESVDGMTKTVNPVEATATPETQVDDSQPQSRGPRREAAKKAREWMQA